MPESAFFGRWPLISAKRARTGVRLGAVLVLAATLLACTTTTEVVSTTVGDTRTAAPSQAGAVNSNSNNAAPRPDLVTASDETDVGKRSRIRLELASAYFAQGQSGTALDEVKRALQADPNSAAAYNLRGLIYASMSENALAEESFRRSLSLSGSDANALHNYAWFLCRQQRFPDARRYFEQALKVPQYREQSKTLLAQGVCEARAGDLSAAERLLLRSYELDAGNPATAFNLAEVLMRKGDLDRSRFYLQRVNPGNELANAETLWLAARIEHRRKNPKAVDDLGSQLRARFPGHGKVPPLNKDNSMSEPTLPASAVPSAAGVQPGAGALLRAAREARGLELDQFALLLKVPIPKLEALEADRLDQLPGLAFVRGLATAMARQLDIDPQPILAALPAPVQAPQALENVTRGLATPYREPGSRMMPGSWPEWLRLSVIAPALLLLLALVFWLAPPMRMLMREPVAAAASSVQATVAASQPATDEVRAADGADNGGAVSTTLAPSASAVVETVHSAPPEEPSASQKAAAAGSVVLRTSADSWIEARDGAGALLMSRMLPAGEVVGLDGSLPIKLKIGNADGTRVHFRGDPIDLNPYTRDNVARLELK